MATTITQVRPAVPLAQQDNSAIRHLVQYDPNPKTRTWERLEKLRLKKLGLTSQYSRHFNVTRSYNRAPTAVEQPHLRVSLEGHPQGEQYCSHDIRPHQAGGSYAPFSSLGKPTCGFFFSRETINKKQKIGIPATNLVKWRTFTAESLH